MVFRPTNLPLKIDIWLKLFETVKVLQLRACVKCFLRKNGTLVDWKLWWRKMTTLALLNHYQAVRAHNGPICTSAGSLFCQLSQNDWWGSNHCNNSLEHLSWEINCLIVLEKYLQQDMQTNSENQLHCLNRTEHLKSRSMHINNPDTIYTIHLEFERIEHTVGLYR